MDSTNKRAPGERGAGDGFARWNGRDSTTAATHDALRSACADQPGGRR